MKEGNKLALKVLMNKVPKNEIVNALISVLEAVCTTPEEEKEVLKMVSVYVHTREVLEGKKSIDDFQPPLKDAIQEKIDSLPKVMA